ncbi:uncharacterized [Tachysurus ichikawai]
MTSIYELHLQMQTPFSGPGVVLAGCNSLSIWKISKRQWRSCYLQRVTKSCPKDATDSQQSSNY